MIKRFIWKFFLLVLILISAFCCLEVVLLFYNPQVIFKNHTTSKYGVATAFRSDIQRDLLFHGFPYQIKTDSKGLRNFKEISYKKERDVFRVLCIGGSIFAASGVNNDETFAFYLNHILKEKFPNKKVEVINAGKNLWELSEFFAYFKNEGYKYSPDLVVVYFHRGELSTLDLSEFEANKVKFKRLTDNKVEIEIRGFEFAHHLNKVSVTFLNFIHSIPFYDFVFSKSQAIRFIESHLRNNLVFDVGDSSKRSLKKSAGSWALKDDDFINWKTDYWELKDKTKQHIPAILYSIGIDRFYSLLQEHETKLLFLLVPSREEVLKMDKGFKEFKPMQVGRHKNMIWLDLKKDLIEIQNRSYIPLNFPTAIHFTPAGHLSAATLAFNRVVEKDFMFTDDPNVALINFRDSAWIKNLQRANSRINTKLSHLGYDFLIKGILNKNQNKFDEAEKFLKLASKEKAMSVEAAWQLGRLYFVRRDYGNSVDYIQKALKRGLFRSDAVFSLLGKAYYNLKRFDSAEKYFKNAIEISSNNFRNYQNYAQMLFFSKRFEESLAQYKKANLIVPNQIDILLGVGGASFLIGKDKEALRVFEEILKIKPNNVQALSGIERIKARLQ